MLGRWSEREQVLSVACGRACFLATGNLLLDRALSATQDILRRLVLEVFGSSVRGDIGLSARVLSLFLRREK
jgi:hypothetical protein